MFLITETVGEEKINLFQMGHLPAKSLVFLQKAVFSCGLQNIHYNNAILLFKT